MISSHALTAPFTSQRGELYTCIVCTRVVVNDELQGRAMQVYELANGAGSKALDLQIGHASSSNSKSPF